MGYPPEHTRNAGNVPGHTHNINLQPIRDMAPEYREPVRVKLSVVLDEFCDNIIAGVRKNKRDAMNSFARIMGLIGAEVEINVNLATMHAFGLPADDVRQIIEAHQSSSATTIEQCSEDGIALLQWVLTQEPERRAAVLAALGGEGADTEVPRLEAPGPNGHA